MIHPIGLVDTRPELSQMSLPFSINQCPKYVCMSSFSHDLPFEVCKFPIARHTHLCVAIQWNLVRGLGLTHDHALVPDHGLVLEISGYLFKLVIFHKRNYGSGAE